MAREIISINELIRGAQPTDPRREAYRKANANFAELYARSELVTVVLANDVVNNNVTPNTMADVTGLLFPVINGAWYEFEFRIVFDAAATTTGSRWAINGPAASVINYRSEYMLTATSATYNPLLQAYDLPAAASVTSGVTAGNWALIKGVIKPSANGNVVARFASEVASSAITAKAGSYLRYQKLT